ncbi:MAG: sigma-70 family RNA polymerase sigma factor [Planctomycetota bacterium]|nr:MAG: sigma-70 family RNA polymerase sigma factor [Planctomycetota bacterium]
MPKPQNEPRQPRPSPAPGPSSRLEALFRDYGSKVYRLALRCGLDPEEAEDGVQEVFLKVQRRIDTFRGEAALSTWLYQVALNTLLDHRRRVARACRSQAMETLESGELPGVSEAEPPDEAASRLERRQVVRRALERLPLRFREMLILRDLEGLSYRDIARVLGLAQGTVESRIFRARERLARELGRMEESL